MHADLYRIAGNFRGRKLSQSLKFCSYLRKSSLPNLGAWHLLVASASNLQKFFSVKIFSPICKSFLPGKFPAIR